MKKSLAGAVFLLAATAAQAQSGTHRDVIYNPEVVNIVSILFVLLASMVFILTILKRVLDYRLKNRIVDKGLTDQAASAFLQPDTKTDRHANIKWAALLSGSGLGLTLIHYTQPLGIHSLAILFFSIALGFLVYFLYLRQAGR